MPRGRRRSMRRSLDGRASRTASTGAPAGRARAAARRSSRAARATTTGSPTGARPASCDPACGLSRPRSRRRGDRDGVQHRDSGRAPHLYKVLRAFCSPPSPGLGPESRRAASSRSSSTAARAGSPSTGRSSRDHVEARAFVAGRAAGRADRARRAAPRPGGGDLRARAAGRQSSENRALFRALLLPLLDAHGEGCGGFDWEDGAFERVYAGLERSLFGSPAVYLAVAPVVGLSVGERGRARPRHPRPASPSTDDALAGVAELLRRLRQPAGAHVRARARARAAAENDAARRAGRGRGRRHRAQARDRGAGRRRAGRVRAARLAPVRDAAGPRDRGDRARGRADAAGSLARKARRRPARQPGRVEDDAELAEALERWELSLFEDEPLRSERLREALAALLGGADGLWAAAMRAAVLVGETPGPERGRVSSGSRALARGDRADEEGRTPSGGPSSR